MTVDYPEYHIEGTPFVVISRKPEGMVAMIRDLDPWQRPTFWGFHHNPGLDQLDREWRRYVNA